MAIEIITKGKTERPTYTRTCPECGCVFEYKYADTLPNGWNGGYVSIECPQCGYQVAHINGGGGTDINFPKLED